MSARRKIPYNTMKNSDVYVTNRCFNSSELGQKHKQHIPAKPTPSNRVCVREINLGSLLRNLT